MDCPVMHDLARHLADEDYQEALAEYEEIHGHGPDHRDCDGWPEHCRRCKFKRDCK